MQQRNTTPERPLAPKPALSPRAWGTFLALAVLTTGCGSSGGGSSQQASLPSLSTATFTTPSVVNHPLWNFPADESRTYSTEGNDEPEVIVVERVPGTRTVMGIECIRVRDRVFVDDLLIEDTEDWYAQDDAGNVWYMGEESVEYEYDDDGNVIGTSTDGSWEAGLDPLGTGTAAQAGYVMRATPRVGDFYYQEFYPGEAEDIGRVVQLNVPVVLSDGSTYTCVKVRETSSLDPNALEFKYYATGLGVVLVEHPSSSETEEYRGSFVKNATSLPAFDAGDFSAPDQITHALFPQPAETTRLYFAPSEDEPETIVIERLPGTRSVAGIACARVRDRVFVDGLLVEDTEDWFAQDDAGNVWYMGEESVDFEYDDDGNVIGTSSDGSWEAGLDVAGVGEIAKPGYQLRATALPGTSYYQEFYPDEAEDMGFDVATDASVTLPDGREFTNCLRTLDWNPLEPDGLEYKLYAPGVGLVSEQGLHEGSSLSLVGVLDRSADSLPDFGSAAFTLSTLIDNDLLPMPIGATWEYEEETDDGLETVLLEVLPAVRTVAGVMCVAVRAQEFLDGVIQEDTEDWFAQDDAGNVWYFGEEVTNYEYDDDGNLLGTNDDGSWEAGLDVAGVGSIAEPGIVMFAAPVVGTSYYQEFYLTSAEDMGQVVATDVTVEVDGTTYTGCVTTLDWNPLEPEGLEYKTYAPGVGLVHELDLNDDVELTLTDTSL